MASKWTDELKQLVVDEYVAAEPTPENSMEIVTQIAEAHDQSPNGVRVALTNAGVYIKKVPASGGTKEGGGSGGKRVSKDAAIASLKEAIQAMGKEVDSDILDKMTGKAAVYFAGLLTTED